MQRAFLREESSAGPSSAMASSNADGRGPGDAPSLGSRYMEML